MAKKLKNSLSKMKKLFEEIDAIYRDIPTPVRDEITLIHNSEGSIPHCIYFGIQACKENLENFKNTIRILENEGVKDYLDEWEKSA
jgi:hypothetical protein